MIKLIKSIIAAFCYQKALSSLGGAFPGQALGQLNWAIKIEPNEKYTPRYLSLKAEIEMELGKKDKALETLTQAKEIIAKYPEYWETEAQRKLSNRVKDAIREFEAKS